MKKLNSPLSFAFLFSILFSLTSAKAEEAGSEYQFTPSPDCELFRYVKRDWQKTRLGEVGAAEVFMLHDVAHQPELSSFYAHHELYSAKKKCFSLAAKPESKKPEPEHEVAQAHEAEHEHEHGHEEVEMESEFLHQAKRHVLEVTPSIGYASTSIHYQNLPTDSKKVSGEFGGLVLEYGLTPNFSVGAACGYDSFSNSTTPVSGSSTSSKGFEDLKVFVNGKKEFENSAVRLNLVFDQALAHHRTDQDNNTNVASGDYLFTPALGYEMHVGHNIFGAQIADDLIKGNKTNETVKAPDDIDVATVQGGKAFTGALFFEHRYRKGEYGTSFQYLNVSHTTENGVDKNNHGSIWIATLYGEIEMSEKISLLPALTYSKPNFLEEEDKDNVNSVASFGVILGARFKIL